MNAPLEPTATLSADQKRALLARLLREKAKATRPARPALAHQLVERQAATTPDATAVSGAGGLLTYRELNAAANRVAHRLRNLGVGPDVLVGLAVERSPAMVVGLLAVLKAGGAYVPLDPAFPAGRLALMLDDARPAVLLTQQSLRETLPAGDATVVCLDSDWEDFESQAATDPEPLAGPDHLAYVIYTSGSTGKPKGVQIPHGALANFLTSLAATLGVTDRDALLAVTTLSFDIAALELLLPLTVGARIELATREEAADGAALAARLAGSGATFLQATPATWRLLLDGGWAGSPGLTLLCGGEALPRALADRLLDKGHALWNLYGPTETTVWSSLGRVEPGEGPITVGRAIAATQLYVLDARLRPVPVGVTGELYIGGAGVARGYLGRPSLTAERFIPDPFGKARGARLYRTGDLARWRPDGALECLGRIDHQVKVRGFRVELGDIEAALAAHPNVAAAAAAARDDATGEKALAAYLVPRGEPGPTAPELRAWLRERLPEYMVPSAFVTLDALPLTPNGKVDRNALPDPEAGRLGGGDGYVPPRGPVEEAIAGIWGELLGRDRVGVHDNFFDLGGHSLFATQLLARLRDVFAAEPSLAAFLDEPTVAGLARVVERDLSAGAGLAAPPVTRVERDGPLPASFAQQRLWFLDRLEQGTALYNIPTAVRLTGQLDVVALGRALDEVFRRHEALRTTFTDVGGVPFQVVQPAAPLPLPVVDLQTRPEAEREAEARRLIESEARRPFDLGRGPLVRATLLRLSDAEHVVLVTMHHVSSDGWSVGVLVREVAALYEAFRQGEPSPLPELPLQYADFAVWQRGWLRGEVLQAQLDYWTGRLAGVPPLELPTDRPRPASPSHRGGVCTAVIPKELLDAARAFGRREGATLYMTLLAAFAALLHRYSGQADFAVGSPIAGRTRSELEGLIGFFVNTLVLRADLADDPGFRTLLARVRREALGAYAHQDLPFEQLVGVLHPGRGDGRSPVFQVMFVLQNAPLPLAGTPELGLEVLDTASGTAKFDLTLAVSEEPGGLSASLEYSADLFDAATADRMLAHFATLLKAAVSDPDRPVSALPMLSEAERRALLAHGQGDAAVAVDDLSDDDLDALLSELTPGDAPNDD